MSKPKTPFLSLDARGSIGGSITAQAGIAGTIIRTKPFPKDPYSLRQAYRRWLYQDYAYLWSQQTDAVKAQYRTLGTRYHLTSLQYWMKIMLKSLPDIVAWYKLDERIGSLAHDSGLQNHNGTIFGASPTPCVIDYGYHFDNINDYIDLGASLAVPPHFTFEAFFVLHGYPAAGDYDCIISKMTDPASSFHALIGINPTGSIYSTFADLSTPTTYHWVADLNKQHHVALTYDGAHLIAYKNGDLYQSYARTGTPGISSRNFNLGNALSGGSRVLNGVIDNAIIYNRALDATQIKMHSERRYPPE